MWLNVYVNTLLIAKVDKIDCSVWIYAYYNAFNIWSIY